MKKALVSFAVGSHYVDKMKRLEQSLKGNFDGDFLGFTSFEEIGSPIHGYSGEAIPFAFKPYAVQRAVDMGYDLILWCDSQVYAKSNIQNVFDYIHNHFYLIFDNIGYSIGDFTNDRTIEHFGITRDESWKLKMVNAKVFGYNATSPEAMNLWFSEYYNLIDLYKGELTNRLKTESQDLRVQGHRHDQSVLSCLAHKYQLRILKSQDTFFANEDHRRVMQIADSVCLWAG